MATDSAYFYDFEFLEDGRTIEPISVGIAAYPSDRTYYAVFAEVDDGELHKRIRGHKWLMENVVPHLPLREGHERGIWRFEGDWNYALDSRSTIVRPKRLIANEVREFLQAGLTEQEIAQDDTSRVQLWADYGAYDHVRLMQLWGPMMTRPRGLPMWTHDLRQFAEQTGLNPDDAPTTLEGNQHHALHDALRLREQWLWMTSQRREITIPLVTQNREPAIQVERWRPVRPVRDNPQA